MAIEQTCSKELGLVGRMDETFRVLDRIEEVLGIQNEDPPTESAPEPVVLGVVLRKLNDQADVLANRLRTVYEYLVKSKVLIGC